MDTEGVKSFIKKKFVPKNFEIIDTHNEENFYGVNKSQLKLYGKIKVKIKFKEMLTEIELFVVANDTMNFDIVLGRDYLRKINFKLVHVEEVNNEKDFEN